MPIELNDRYRDQTPSPTLLINEQVNALWQAGKTVYHLGFGESRFPVHPLLSEALCDAAEAKSYSPAGGLPELREAVATYYSRQLHKEIGQHQVFIGPGSKALIYALQMVIRADLYLPAASWVSYAPQARMLGKPVHVVPGQRANDYALDLEALARLSPDTRQKLLIINSPSNPTGRMMDDGFLQELTRLCREHNFVVLSDEIYSRVQHGAIEHSSLARYYPEGTIVLGGLSKHLSLGGWRLGVAIAPDTRAGAATFDAMESIASEIWSAVSAPVQKAAAVAYSGHPDIEAYIATCSAIHAVRTRFLRRKLDELGIRCSQPQGAFYLTANFNHWAGGLAKLGIHTSAELALHLLNQYQIATLPCDAFGLPATELTLRLASSYLDMETASAAESLLRRFESRPSPEAFMSESTHPNTHACLAAFERFVQSLGG